MKKNYLLKAFSVLVLWLSISLCQDAFSQTADLRVVGSSNCALNSYTAVVQIKAATLTSFSIGTSSIYLTYNPASLSYVSYQSQNFSPANLCIGGVASSWDSHTIDGTTPGVFNLTITLLNNTFSCPSVTNADWITVGTIAFSVVNPSANPTIAFNSALTNFNSVPANDGSNPIAKGTLTGINQPLGIFSAVSISTGASACNPATNSYELSGNVTVTNPGAAGTLTLTTGALSQTVAIGSGNVTVPYSISGLSAVGGTQTITVLAPNCGSVTASYTAPVSCSASVSLPCAVNVAVTPGTCNSATNQYTLSGLLSLTNATQAQSVTITNGIQTVTAALAANTSSLSFTMNGLPSDGLPRTLSVLFSGTACSAVSQQYSAPASCSVVPPANCFVNVAVTPGTCNSVTNQYSLSGVLSLAISTQAQTITITNGIQSVTAVVAANTSSFSFTMNGLTSDGVTRTLSVLLSATACSLASQQYSAPASCSGAAPAQPCGVALAVNPGSCNSATNQYTLAGTLSLTNITQTTSVTISNGIQTVIGSIPANATSFTFAMTGLASDGANRTVTALFSGTACSVASQQYSAPASCSCIPAVITSAIATRATCTGTTTNNDASIQFTATGGVQYLVTGPGVSLNSPATLVNGQATITGLPNPATTATYTITVLSNTSGPNCSPVQQTVTLQATNCNCPPAVCVPVTAERIR